MLLNYKICCGNDLIVALMTCCFAFVANMQPVWKNEESMYAAKC